MNLRHSLWLPWGMRGSVQTGVSGVETRAGLLGGAKCLDLYVLEAEGTRAADKLNMATGGGGGREESQMLPRSQAQHGMHGGTIA